MEQEKQQQENAPANIVGCVNPMLDIPELFFNFYRMYHMLGVCLTRLDEEASKQLAIDADNFALENIKKRYPHMDISLKVMEKEECT